MTTLIRANQLKKNYGSVQALKGINLDVTQGEIYGFIGPNGAGKSTTIRILLGLLSKTAGTVSLLGGDPLKDSVELHKRLAYIPSDVNLWPNMTGGEVIDLLGRLRGQYSTSRRKALIERFNLDPTKKCRTYSKGNRQKVALISAFISDVELYIMDEPTSGLDPLMELVFQECVLEAKKEGKTVFLSSHILAEVEKLCDRVSIIKDGLIAETGTLAELRHFSDTSVTVETKRKIEGLSNISGVHRIIMDGNKASFYAESRALDQALTHIAAFGVQAISCAPPTLEELFKRHYEKGGESREEK